VGKSKEYLLTSRLNLLVLCDRLIKLFKIFLHIERVQKVGKLETRRSGKRSLWATERMLSIRE